MQTTEAESQKMFFDHETWSKGSFSIIFRSLLFEM